MKGLDLDWMLTIDETGMPQAPTIKQLLDRDVALLCVKCHKYIHDIKSGKVECGDKRILRLVKKPKRKKPIYKPKKKKAKTNKNSSKKRKSK
jgi:hypothetical protein